MFFLVPLFNSLPRVLRDMDCSLPTFKAQQCQTSLLYLARFLVLLTSTVGLPTQSNSGLGRGLSLLSHMLHTQGSLCMLQCPPSTPYRCWWPALMK